MLAHWRGEREVEKEKRNLEMPVKIGGVVCLTRRSIYESDIRKLAKLSAEAYREPPSHLAIFLTDGDLEETLIGYQEMLLRAILKEGGIAYAIRSEEEEDDYIATVWWLPPGRDLTARVMAPYLWQFTKEFGLKRLYLLIIASLAVLKAFEKAKKYFGRPHAHLMNIVVKEEFRRQGLARMLLQPILEWADGEKVVLVLEADGYTNIRKIYPRFGFESWGKIKVDRFPYQIMLRFPQ